MCSYMKTELNLQLLICFMNDDHWWSKLICTAVYSTQSSGVILLLVAIYTFQSFLLSLSNRIKRYHTIQLTLSAEALMWQWSFSNATGEQGIEQESKSILEYVGVERQLTNEQTYRLCVVRKKCLCIERFIKSERRNYLGFSGATLILYGICRRSFPVAARQKIEEIVSECWKWFCRYLLFATFRLTYLSFWRAFIAWIRWVALFAERVCMLYAHYPVAYTI